MDNNIIIKQEVEAILTDIITLYNASDKRTTGEFEKGLEAVYEHNKATIKGYTYLAGRKAGKQPPVDEIKKWVINKGIQSVKDNITVTSLAWAIAKSISKRGTKGENNLKIYEQVITPQRINTIINKVSEFNVNKFIEEVTTSLEILEKNI